MRVRPVAFFAFLGAVVALLFTASPARAWYFPEHVVLSADGHGALPPEIRDVLAAAGGRRAR